MCELPKHILTIHDFIALSWIYRKQLQMHKKDFQSSNSYSSKTNNQVIMTLELYVRILQKKFHTIIKGDIRPATFAKL